MNVIRRSMLVALVTATLASPAFAEVNGQSGGYLQSLRGKPLGLVTVTQEGANVVLAFNLFGLAPNTKHRLVASSKGCSSRPEKVFSRSFTTDSKGTSWDPVPIRADATTIKSVSIRDRAAGTRVSCAKATIPVGPGSESIKIDAPKSVLMVSEANADWQLLGSFSGLAPKTRYRAVALPGGCVAGAQPLFGKAFRSNAQGNAVVRVEQAQTPGTTVGAVALLERSSGKVMFCKAV